MLFRPPHVDFTPHYLAKPQPPGRSCTAGPAETRTPVLVRAGVHTAVPAVRADRRRRAIGTRRPAERRSTAPPRAGSRRGTRGPCGSRRLRHVRFSWGWPLRADMAKFRRSRRAVTHIRFSHVHRSNPSFCKFVSDRSVGRRSAGRPVGVRSLTTAKPRATPKPTGPPPSRGQAAPVHVSATDPSRKPSGKPRPALRALLPVGRQRDTRHTRPMTTPVTVSQSIRQPEARTVPPRPAIVAAPGGRRGEAPGRRTSRRVPASPTISAGDRYGTGESSVLPAPRRPSATPAGVRAGAGLRASRQRVPRRGGPPLRRRARARHRPPGRSAPAAPPSRNRRARARSIQNSPRTAVGRTPGPQRSRPCDRPRRRPADRRTGARTHAYRCPRSLTPQSAQRRRAGGRAGARSERACCKTEIPG